LFAFVFLPRYFGRSTSPASLIVGLLASGLPDNALHDWPDAMGDPRPVQKLLRMQVYDDAGSAVSRGKRHPAVVPSVGRKTAALSERVLTPLNTTAPAPFPLNLHGVAADNPASLTGLMWVRYINPPDGLHSTPTDAGPAQPPAITWLTADMTTVRVKWTAVWG